MERENGESGNLRVNHQNEKGVIDGGATESWMEVQNRCCVGRIHIERKRVTVACDGTQETFCHGFLARQRLPL